ncbi:flagellar filament capping protein FliD [Halopseudomonas nanhaiensis]|uniref:flagellar filament capping protein FliD n=1 Tax=Halopseudomonas nanhaiensis TaxID=2830842 RepID=UPI001CBBDF34|nr:flagellar filament capping protein FliD [Halopseudomonas nanhaiensis]UAW99237.1 flagellar filament capping protein FliD [Halopseudomonas nanhaiensis]
MAITGIGSGLDIKGMVAALVNAEAAPKTAQLNRLEKATTAKFSALGQFRSALSEFQTTVKDLNSASLFEKRTASSGKADIFTVSADTKAVAGSYNVQVFNLAQTSKIALKGLDDPAAKLGAGQLEIKVGDETIALDITEEASNLTGIRDAINAAGKEKGLSATIVSDPSGVGGARLVLSSTKSGTGNDISVTGTSTATTTGTPTLADLSFTPPAPGDDFVPPTVTDPRAPKVISFARDANLAIDGINLASKTNSVSEAIDGVTITLKAAQSKEDVTNVSTISLTVGEDRAGVKSSLKKFVDGYNKLMSTIGSLTKVTPVGGDSSQPLAGGLVGDASVRTFMSGMRSDMGNPAGGGELKILSDLGISTQRDGTLKVDDAKLDKVLADNFDQVSSFLTGDAGLMAKLENTIKPYTQSDGIIESRTKGLQSTLDSVDDQREVLNRRIGKLETRLLAQFNKMDTLIGQMSGTSDYLAGVLNSLPGVVKKDK